MARPPLLVLGMFTTVFGGCAHVASHDAPPATGVTLPLSGLYEARLHSRFTGSLSARLSATPSQGEFAANSRPGVAWTMIGGIEGILGPLVMPNLFPEGVILYWTSSAPTDGSPATGWLSVGRLENVGVKTHIEAPDEPVELLASDGRQLGLMTLRPAEPNARPETNYAVLASNIAEALRTGLYDAEAARSSQVRAYERGLSRVGSIARDDAEFVFGALATGRNSIKFLLPLVYRRLDPEMAEALTGERALPTVQTTFDARHGIATIKVDVFLDVEEVDRAFRAALGHEPRAIILDLRSSPGVTLAALRAAAWVVRERTDVGVFFGARARARVIAGSMSDVADITLASPSDFAELESLLRTAGEARVAVDPVGEMPDLPVIVLTGKRTSSSSEVLVSVLKGKPGVLLIGEPTAGRPLVSDEFDVGQGWVLRAAAYDFTPTDGERLNGVGVPPDERVSSWRARGAARRAVDRMLNGTENSHPAGTP